MNRIIFVGAVELSQAAYEELLAQGIEPVLLVTLLPKLGRRHSDFVDLTKVNPKIPYLLVDNINDHYETLRGYGPDYILVWGWSQLIKQELIDLPTKGCLGLHPAPLPRGRGRGVIPWTILTQQPFTGLTIFSIDAGVDSGNIITQTIFPVDPDETARSLYNKTKWAAHQLVREIAPTLKEGTLTSVVQDHSQATYFAKRIPSDGLIDWNKSAVEINRLVRATTHPYPGAYTYYNGVKLIIWESYVTHSNCVGVPGQILKIGEDGHIIVQCGSGNLVIYAVTKEGNSDICLSSSFVKTHARFSSTPGDK